MIVQELLSKLLENAHDTQIMVIDTNDSLPRTITDVELESDPDSTGLTLWLKVEES